MAAAPRIAHRHRQTRETDIELSLALDGAGAYKIATGIGFLDHMLEQFSRHSLIDIELTAKGDLHVDQHHVVEDSAIVLGEALEEALGDKQGIKRYGAAMLPMDEACARCLIDISGRAHLRWRVELASPRLGGMDTELFAEWFAAFSRAGNLTLHMEVLYGENSHHRIEACYKALARALREAVALDPAARRLPVSTKTLEK